MTTSRHLGVFLVAAAFTQMSGLRLMAASSPYFLMQKEQIFDQISSNGPVPDIFTPFSFDASSPVPMSFTPPGGASTPLTLAQGGGKYSFGASYSTLSA